MFTRKDRTANRPRVVVIGNSHTQAIKKAVHEADGILRNIRFEAYTLHRKVRTAGTDISMEEARKIISSLSSDDVLVSAVGGSVFQIYGLIEHPQPFDVWGSDAGETFPVSGREVIPEGVMYSALEEAMKAEKKTLRRLCSVTSCCLFHLEAPPPKGDNTYVQINVGGSIRNRVGGDEVAPPSLRLRLWKIQGHVLRHFCERIKVRYVGAPPPSVESPGYLKRAYYGKDATHANAAYGALILQQIADIIEAR